MRATGQVRPSKPASAIGIVVGAVFVGIGVFVVIPGAGLFGVIWTLLALVGTGYHAANVFSEHGVAHEVVEFDTSSQAEQQASATASPEQRLSNLDKLKQQELVSDQEYTEHRTRILDEL